MAKKRKSDASRLDEVDRSMYSTFCSGASFLSQLYTQSMSQQRLYFQAGERHALEKLHTWIGRQQEGGVRMTTGDILAYMQNELDFGSEEPPSPRLPLNEQQPSQTVINAAQSGLPAPFDGVATSVQGQRPVISDQSKNNNFSNALHYHLAHNAMRTPPNFNDTPMDMQHHPDSSLWP